MLGLRGNGSVTPIWQWNAGAKLFQGVVPSAAQADAETGRGVDPIQINGAAHGYVQGMVDLALLGLTPQCLANLLVRSVNEAAVGDGDLQVGEVGACVPVDANDDGVRDLVNPMQPCTGDDQCPGDGICVDGICIVPDHCMSDADCSCGRRRARRRCRSGAGAGGRPPWR